MIVVDASVAVKWYAPEQGHQDALDLINDRDELIALDLIVYEVLNALRQKLKRQEVTSEQFRTAPTLLFEAIKILVPAKSLSGVAASLSLSLDHPIYDCAYLACAMEKNAILLTADNRLMRKIVDRGLGHLARLLVDGTGHTST